MPSRVTSLFSHPVRRSRRANWETPGSWPFLPAMAWWLLWRNEPRLPARCADEGQRLEGDGFMLRQMSREPVDSTVREFVPPIARPLVDASAARQQLAPALQKIVRGLEFTHFLYRVTASVRPTHEPRAFAWTSEPGGWVRLYDERAYIEADPRLSDTWESPLPWLWDRTNCARSPAERDFFDAATRYGVNSGVAVPLRHKPDAPGHLVLSSAIPVNDAARRRHVTNVLGQVIILATFVHDLFLASVIDQGLPVPSEGRPLSARERECLQLAARGMRSRQIGAALRIGERTVESHFANLLTKLGAATRQEAIAMASAARLIIA